MKKLWNKIRSYEYSYLFFAFLIPLALMWLIFIALGVYPFGENSVLVLDLNGQYVYFFEGLRDKLVNGGSLLYTWKRAMGGEFMGIFAYYLSSPFSLLVALFPKRHITEALLTIILLKIGACGGTMGFYLHKTYKTDKIKTIIFSVLYALSAYVVVYGHNLMWLDGLFWLPILTYSIEQLIKKGKFKLFVVSLTMSVMANFYIGFMTCIYVVIYFFYYYISHSENGENNFWCEKKHFIKSLLRIALYSLVAVAIACWILLPTYASLKFGKTDFTNPNYEFVQRFDFLQFISKLLYGSYDTVRPEGFPMMYCGILTLILVPIYFFSKKIKAREKLMGMLLIAVFIFSFNASPVDMFWHGLQKPNWLNYRYSFMLIFILLVMAYKGLDAIKDLDFKWVAVSAALWCGLIFAVQAQHYEYVNNLDTIWASLGLILIFVVILYSIKKGFLAEGSVLILCVVVCVEMFTAGLLNAIALDEDVTISTRTSYISYVDQYTEICNDVTSSDTSFYRMEKNSHRKTNDTFSLGFNGLSGSTSTLNASQIKFMNQLGYSSKSHWSKYLGGNQVNDSLLGVKYVIYDDSANANPLYTLYKKDDSYDKYAYENPYALSIAYSSSTKIVNFDGEQYYTPFEYTNALIAALNGKSDPIEVYKKLDITNTSLDNLDKSYISGHTKYTPIVSSEGGSVTYTFMAPPNTTLYCFFPSDYPRECKLSVNGQSRDTFFANETDRIVELGSFEESEIKVELTLDDDNLYISDKSDFYFAYIDEDLFKVTLEDMQKGQMKISEHSDTRLYGTIDVPDNMSTLFTTIVYDEGWHVYIDGEETPIFETAGALLACPITSGEHTVEFKYMPSSFVYGSIIAVCGVAVFAGAIVLERLNKKRRQKRWITQGI